MRWVVLLAFAACGGSSSSFVPGDCAWRCERAKEQLTKDFGIQNPSCWDSEIFGVDSAAKCNALFEKRWGVLPTG